jgi:transcriptional regulator with XRE-family HTH domain
MNLKILMLRKKAGLEQKELAEKVGVSGNTVSRWELGRAKISQRHAEKVAEIFGVEISEVIDELPTKF